MAIQIERAPGGKRSTSRSGSEHEAVYNIIGTRNEDVAYSEFYGHLMRNAPVMNGLPIESVDVEGNEDGGKLFIGTVKYSNKKPILGIGVPTYSWSTKGGAAKKAFGRELIAKYGPNPPDFGTGINFTEGKFEGTDIIVPKWAETVKITLLRSIITRSFKRMLRNLTGKVNLYPFLGLAPGECLFYGVDGNPGEIDVEGREKPLPTCELTFEFHGMPNMTDTIAGIGEVSKDGWDYSWVYSIDVPDMLSNKLVKKPKNAFVVRTYERVNLNVLGF